MKIEAAVFMTLAFLLLISPAAGAFEENVGMKDKADAKVDRPPINHLKAFLNQNIPSLYQMLFADSEKSSG